MPTLRKKKVGESRCVEILCVPMLLTDQKIVMDTMIYVKETESISF